MRSKGAIPDCRRLTDISATSGSANISSNGLANFTTADNGKIINLYDYANGNYVARAIFTYVSPTTGTLSIVAGNNLSASNCIGYIGTDNSNAIKNALLAAAAHVSPVDQGANLALGGGNVTVIFPSDSRGNMYAFGTQQVVQTNVTLDADAMMVPMCGTAATNSQGNANRVWPFILMPGANIKRMQFFHNFTMGIIEGTYTQQAHSTFWDLTQWDVGSNNTAGSIAMSSHIHSVSGVAGFAVGDTITLTGGTHTSTAVLTVYAVNSSGQPTQCYVSTPGFIRYFRAIRYP